MGRRKVTNQNWTRDETLSLIKTKALKEVEKRKKFESTRKFKAVRVDARTVKYVEIKE